MDPFLLVGVTSCISAAGTGVSKDIAVGVREAIPGIYCGFGEDLINVPGNLKMPSRWQRTNGRGWHS